MPPGAGALPDTALSAALLDRCTFPPAGSPLVCAVSGGADSLALLALAVGAGCDVTAVHVDHGLRPGSAAEADVVAAAAERLGAGFRRERVEVADGGNLEARARAARFAVLPADAATGHTMDDQAETVLCNLLRGTGLGGLAAMSPGPRHPLLGIRRSDTRALCTELGLAWVEDPSNEDPRHLRNRVRHELLPLCAVLSRRDPVPVLARLAGLARGEGELLDALAASAVPDVADAAHLAAVPVPLARRALRRWLRDVRAAGGGAAVDGPVPSGVPEAFEGGDGPDRGGDATAGRARAWHPPSLAEVDRVLAVAAGAARGAELSGGLQVRRRRGRLVVEPGCSGKVSPVTTKQAAQAPAPAGAPPAGSASTGSVPAALPPGWAGPGVGPEVVSADALARRIAQLGEQVTADYAAHPPLLVGVLKGAMVFISDLSRAIDLPVELDFMAVSSYGSSTRTSGVVRIVKDLDAEVTGRHVLVVEDIIDSGLTLNYLRRYLQARSPASVEICALLVKEGQQRVDLDLRYIGFSIPSTFVVGYGLDVAERYRNLPGVHEYHGPPGGHR